MLATRWRTLASACALESVAGITYAFALYSNALRERFGLSQRALDFISTAENSAGYLVVFIATVLYCNGPRPTMLVAAAIGVPSWLGLYGAIAITSVDAPYWLLLLCSLGTGVSCGLLDLVAVCCVSASFPERRGQAVGTGKALVGLSAALCSSAYAALFAPDVTSLVLFLGLETGVACLLGAALIVMPPPGSEASVPSLLHVDHSAYARRKFTAASWMIALLAATLVGGSLLTPLAPPSFATAQAVAAYTLLITGLLYVGSSSDVPSRAATAPRDEDAVKNVTTTEQHAVAPPPSLRDVLTFAATVRLVLLFTALTLSVGSGLMLINNLASLHAARSGTLGADPSILVSLFSASNCAGRVLFGYGSDVVLEAYGTSRAHACALATATFGGALLLLTLPPGGAHTVDLPLHATCILGGLAYGGYNCLYPLVLAQLFAVELLAILFPLTFGPAFALGSLLLSTMVYGTQYDDATARHGIDPAIEPCHYADCYVPAVITAAASCAVATLLFLAVGGGARRNSADADPKMNPKIATTSTRGKPPGVVGLL